MTFDFLIFQHYDYNLIDKQLFDSIIVQAIIFFGILSNIVFAPFYVMAPKIAEKQFKNLHPDEIILYTTKNPLVSRFIIFFIFGAFFAMCIYPFITIENLHSYYKIHKSLFYPYIFLYVITMHWLLFFRYSMTYILSDKGIRMFLPYKFSNIYKGKYYGTVLSYSSIASVKKFGILITNFLEITLKQECAYLGQNNFNGLSGFDNLDKIKNIIDSRTKGAKNEQC